MSNWTMPRESLEWVGPLTVTAYAVATTTYTVSLVPTNTHPTTWLPPDALGGLYGLLVGPGGTWVVAPGTYNIWVKVAAVGETPVVTNTSVIDIL